MEEYDLITIGAGSGGVRTSRVSASLGARVLICENSRVGGTCVIRGCVPKKFMAIASSFREEIEIAKEYGLKITGSPQWDYEKFFHKRHAEINRLENIYQDILQKSGVQLVKGTGKILEPGIVEISGTKYKAKNILIATGGIPTRLDIPGAKHALVSDDLFELKKLPKKVIVLGGGYIAVEFAGIFQGFGTEVTQVIRRDLPLRGFDEDIRKQLFDEMVKKGISFKVKVNPLKIEKISNDHFKVHLDNGEILESDCIFMATGRRPNLAALGLDNQFQINNSGAIQVNDHFETSVKGVFAIGDVLNEINLTPVAIRHGMFLANYLFNQDKNKKKSKEEVYHPQVPTAVFSHPPIGTIGPSEQEAKAQYGDDDISCYTSDFKPMKFSLTNHKERAYMKMVVRKSTDHILGLHMLGADSPEIMQGFALAITAGLTKKQVDHLVGIHPTSAEEFINM